MKNTYKYIVQGAYFNHDSYFQKFDTLQEAVEDVESILEASQEYEKGGVSERAGTTVSHTGLSIIIEKE